MLFRCPDFRRGVALTAALALLALGLSTLPGLNHVGALSLALLLGLAVRGCWHLPAKQSSGITFSARHLLRIGIVLIGVRLNFDLLVQAGPRIFLLAASIIITGLCVITWLGRRCGLPHMQALLLAVDSSICGASAVAAAAPVIRARQTDIALVVPICSLIGTFGLLSLACAQHFLNLSPATFGILSGATLHEVAQVMAAATIVPHALEAGTVTKLMRVALLAPAVLILGWLLARGSRSAGQKTSLLNMLGAVWFVFGFLIVGAAHTLICVSFPELRNGIEQVAGFIVAGATFLMTMAMAGLGQQVDFAQLRKNALRTTAVAFAGWLLLVALASAEIRLLHLY